jgi:mannose-6-phosphate isomerase-like protein (cupin superfamily)
MVLPPVSTGLKNETRQVTQGDAVFIPKDALHRVENTGATILVIIETQLGVCVEEDVIWIEDDWGRTIVVKKMILKWSG